MSVPYTYFLYHKPTHKKYYGVRWAKGCMPEDLWTTYFTSSKYVKLLIQQYGKESFIFEIRKTFSDVNSAILWEKKVLRRLNVLTNEEWLNKNISGSIKNDVHPMLNRHHSLETKERIRNSKLGRSLSAETKKKLSESHSGSNHWNYGKKWDKETIEKNRQSNITKRKEFPELFKNPPSPKGRKHNDETKKRMSEARKKYWYDLKHKG